MIAVFLMSEKMKETLETTLNKEEKPELKRMIGVLPLPETTNEKSDHWKTEETTRVDESGQPGTLNETLTVIVNLAKSTDGF